MKKRTIQPTFASLTERELEQLACDLQRETFAAVFARARKPRSEGGLGLDLKSKTPLERLADKKNDLDLLNGILAARGQDKLTFAEYLSMSSGTLTALRAEPSAIHPSSGPITARVAAIHDAIITATHIRVTESDNSPHELLSLQRLADFPARVEIRHHREQLNREKFTHKIDMDNFRKHIATERLTLAQKSFHLREAITTARLQSLNPYDPDQTNQWWDEAQPQNPTIPDSQFAIPNSQSSQANHQSSMIHHQSPPFPPVQNSPALPPIPNSHFATNSQSTPPNHQLSIIHHQSSSLPPEVLANNALYEHKVSIGEIKEISAHGELARVDYSNPGDREFFSTREQSGTARFVPDPTRTTWLPPLRCFGPKPKPKSSDDEPPETTASSADHDTGTQTNHNLK